jgi:cell division protein FtsB
MTAGVVLSLLVAAAVIAFVAAPLLRSDAARAERVAAALDEAAELRSRREMLLASLKDLEDDRATDKIDEKDFAELNARLTGKAVELMKRLDELEQARPSRPVPVNGD